MTWTIALVGCGAAKRVEAVPAKDLYTSNYFDLKRRYAEQEADDWRILSAEHGLLHPDRVTEPYETSIEDVDVEAWAGRVEISLLGLFFALPLRGVGGDVEIVALAGSDYLDPIRPMLDSIGRPARYPFAETSGIGEQMQLLSEAIGRDES